VIHRANAPTSTRMMVRMFNILAVEPHFVQLRSGARKLTAMENSAPEAPGIDLVFDGDCGFCTRSALWIQGRDRDGRVHLHPLQRPGVLERFGLTHEEALSAVWAFRRGGGAGAGFRSTPPYRGAAAVNLAL